MSTFTTEQLKKKWADYEDSESDREEEETSVDPHSSLGQRKKGKDNVLTEKIEKEEVEEDEDEDEEEEEGEDEDDDDLLDLSRIKVGNSLPNQSKGEKKNLSKKEQLELKKKEMEDLETLLAQYREEVPISEVQSKEPADEKVQEKQDDNNDESKGKKKKKKKAASKADTQTDSNTTISTDTPTPVEISAVLKSKVAKKNGSTGKKATPDPLKIAMEEALKSSNNKKKKRDKSKFNEGSY